GERQSGFRLSTAPPRPAPSGHAPTLPFKRLSRDFKSAAEVQQELSRSEVGVKPEDISTKMLKLVDALGEQWLSASELCRILGFRSRNTFRKNYLIPSLQSNLIRMQNQASPNAPDQRYGLTELGKQLFLRDK
ncbi:MAG: Fic family protein, partial [Muribaculaceae bacterium]